MQKAELVKKKNDEVHEESWVQCDTCERWIHQICGLFNSRQNKEHKSEYSCPACLLKKRKKQKKKKEEQTLACSLPGAEALPRTKLSETLENHVRAKVDEKIKSLAEEKSKADVSSPSSFECSYYLLAYFLPFRHALLEDTVNSLIFTILSLYMSFWLASLTV